MGQPTAGGWTTTDPEFYPALTNALSEVEVGKQNFDTSCPGKAKVMEQFLPGHAAGTIHAWLIAKKSEADALELIILSL